MMSRRELGAEGRGEAWSLDSQVLVRDTDTACVLGCVNLNGGLRGSVFGRLWQGRHLTVFGEPVPGLLISCMAASALSLMPTHILSALRGRMPSIGKKVCFPCPHPHASSL